MDEDTSALLAEGANANTTFCIGEKRFHVCGGRVLGDVVRIDLLDLVALALLALRALRHREERVRAAALGGRRKRTFEKKTYGRRETDSDATREGRARTRTTAPAARAQRGVERGNVRGVGSIRKGRGCAYERQGVPRRVRSDTLRETRFHFALDPTHLKPTKRDLGRGRDQRRRTRSPLTPACASRIWTQQRGGAARRGAHRARRSSVRDTATRAAKTIIDLASSPPPSSSSS